MNKLKVFVTSQNPVKIKAVEEVMDYLHNEGMAQAAGIYANEVDSLVGHTPINGYMLLGARNRNEAAKMLNADFDFYISFEGGVEYVEVNMMYCTAVVAVLRKDGYSLSAKAPSVLLPPQVRDMVQAGLELGTAMDKHYDMVNSKQSLGVVGILSNGLVNRKDVYKIILTSALVPLLRHEYAEYYK